MEASSNKILLFAESHPYVLLGGIVLLVFVIILLFLNSQGWLWSNKEGLSKKKKKKLDIDIDDDELDDLIESINEQQRE